MYRCGDENVNFFPEIRQKLTDTARHHTLMEEREANHRRADAAAIACSPNDQLIRRPYPSTVETALIFSCASVEGAPGDAPTKELSKLL